MSLRVTQEKSLLVLCNYVQEASEEPKTDRSVLSGCMQRATSERPQGSSELLRARKDHPAFILPEHCLLGKKVKHETIR